MSYIVSKIIIYNSNKIHKKILIEPWGDEFEIASGERAELTSSGHGEWHIEHDDEHNYIVISLGSGYTVSAKVNGVDILTASKAIRSI